jgi:hypothetical protein
MGSNLVSAVALHCVLLWRALGDLEAIFRVDGVGGVSGSGDFATVKAMAENLRPG